MSEFDKRLALMNELVRREKIRCICIVACVFIVAISALGAMFYCLPPNSAAAHYISTNTDAAGFTITTTVTGRTTTTIVTDNEGRIVAMNVNGSGRR